MKKLYIILIFLVFFNIFSFMFNAIELFPYVYGEGNPSYNLSEYENKSSEEIAESASGYSYDDFLRIILGDVDSLGDMMLTVGILGAAIAMAWLTKSGAPLIIGVVGNLMKNMYIQNMAIFEQFPINNYLMLATGVGMVLLFIITCIEYMVHGHGEV